MAAHVGVAAVQVRGIRALRNAVVWMGHSDARIQGRRRGGRAGRGRLAASIGFAHSQVAMGTRPGSAAGDLPPTRGPPRLAQHC